MRACCLIKFTNIFPVLSRNLIAQKSPSEIVPEGLKGKFI